MSEFGGGRDDVAPGGPTGGLADPDRLRSLAESGLGTGAEPEMDRLAEVVRRRLGVPVALVTIVEPERQVFPGLAGLAEPWAGMRCTPLSHSFCQYVVATAEPLVVADARAVPALRDNRAVHELGVVAYAGMPLTDGDGRVLGSLCAIDSRPHEWTDGELDVLRDLAWGCSMWLRLRLARYDADRERARRDDADAVLRRSFDRSQMLLGALQAFADTASVEDIRERIGVLVATDLAPTYVGMVTVEEDGLVHRVRDPAADPGPEDTGRWSVYPVTAAVPTAAAIREQRPVHYPDRAAFDADYPPEAARLLRDLGLHALVVAPLLEAGTAIGALVLAWDRPQAMDPLELLSITTIAGYAAQALARASRLQHRIRVVEQMQRAMLTDLPAVPGLGMAAHYRPADDRENVGGDWYDAFPLPGGERIVVAVGDIVGHDVTASTIMGQVRSMVRQAGWDRPHDGPAATIAALEAATAGLGIEARGSMAVVHLERLAGRPGAWSVRWSNAGHPPPLVLRRDGRTEQLEGHDTVFGYRSLRDRPRHDHHGVLQAGDTLVLYTDGLVERRGSNLDTGTARLRTCATAAQQTTAGELVDALVTGLERDGADDVAVLAVRIADPGDAPPDR